MDKRRYLKCLATNPTPIELIRRKRTGTRCLCVILHTTQQRHEIHQSFACRLVGTP